MHPTNTEQGKQRKSVEKSEITQDSEVTPFYGIYYMYIYIYLCMYVYIYIPMHVCIYIYIYTYMRCNGMDNTKKLCGFFFIPLWCLKKLNKVFFFQAIGNGLFNID